MQWNGGDSETEYKLLMRTFVSVFPYTTLWGDGSLMLGSMKPFTLSQSAYEARRVTFEQFPWDIATLKRIFIAGPEEIRAFVGDGPGADRRQADDRVFPVAAKERRARRLHRPPRADRIDPDSLTA